MPLYLAAERPVLERDGMLMMIDDDRIDLQPGEVIEKRMVRFRTLGCWPLTGAVESEAQTLLKRCWYRPPANVRGASLTATGRLDGAEETSGVFLEPP